MFRGERGVIARAPVSTPRANCGGGVIWTIPNTLPPKAGSRGYAPPLGGERAGRGKSVGVLGINVC